MDIIKNRNGESLQIQLIGRLDTNTAPQLEEVVNELDGVKDFTLDFALLEYVSSAGLRCLLAAQKKMMSQGTMVIINVNDSIKEIFSITGFDTILTIR